MVLRKGASCSVWVHERTEEGELVWRWLVTSDVRTVTCVEERFDEHLRRSLLDSGEAAVGWMTLAVVRVLVRAHPLVLESMMMLEESEGVEVVAGVVRQSLEGVEEVAVVEGLASLGEVSEAVEVVFARRCDSTILSSVNRARHPSRYLHCPVENVMAPVDSCFGSDIPVDCY